MIGRSRRSYRWVIRTYPPYYRRQHGPELIETALELNGGRWSARESRSFLVQGLALSARIPRRWWGLAAILAIAYGPMLVLTEVVGSLEPHPTSLSNTLVNGTWILKWFTVAALPILLYLLIERVQERPVRWRLAAVLWPSVGAATVLVLGFFRADHAYRVTNAASWATYPGGPELSPELLQQTSYSPAPSLTTLLTHEVIAVVVIALLAARATRLGWRGVAVIPVIVFGGLIVYRALTPWSLGIDFDTFVGDTMLGSAFVELQIPFAPFDGFGAVGISISALIMSIQILAWGGACATDPRLARVPPTFAEAKMMQPRS